MIDCRIGSNMYEVGCWEISEMLGVNIYDLQDDLEREWNMVAYGRYRSV